MSSHVCLTHITRARDTISVPCADALGAHYATYCG